MSHDSKIKFQTAQIGHQLNNFRFCEKRMPKKVFPNAPFAKFFWAFAMLKGAFARAKRRFNFLKRAFGFAQTAIGFRELERKKADRQRHISDLGYLYGNSRCARMNVDVGILIPYFLSFNRSRISPRSSSWREGLLVGAAEASSFFFLRRESKRTKQNIANATMRKSNTTWRKFP